MRFEKMDLKSFFLKGSDPLYSVSQFGWTSRHQWIELQLFYVIQKKKKPGEYVNYIQVAIIKP